MNKRLFYILIGLSIFSFIIYNRIFRIRLPRELYIFPPFTNDVRWFFLFIVFLWIFICFVIIYKNFLAFLHKEEKEPIFSSYSNRLSDFFDKSMFEAYDFICGFHPHSYDVISKIADNFFKIFKDRSIAFTLWITIVIRLIIVIAFFIDIFYFWKLNYFYKSLYLLIIPVIFKIIFYILRHFWTNYEDIEVFINIENIGENYCNFSFKEDYKHLTNLDYYVSQYKLCVNIKNYLDHYDYYSPWFIIRKNLIVYSVFLLGWFYILCKNLYLLIFFFYK